MPPAILALVLVLGLLALIPTRRLARLGWTSGALAAYFVALWVLGAVAASAPGGARILVPLLLIVWLAPFVTWREGLDRLRDRPPRNVTPRDDERS
ncbi:MAG TPA: hypothetical protein VH720_00980 [Candidatus Limnocylindrales bacterium]|jgi:hypothetical protein